MPTNIVETPVKGTTLSVPIGTDKRKASSLTAAWQAIGNRLKFLEDFFDAATGVAGMLAITDNAIWEVADGKTLKIQGDIDAAQTGILDLSLVWAKFNGATRGPLFAADNTGRANRKYLVQDTTATIDPTLRSHVKSTPAGAIILTLTNTPTEAYALGDFVEAINFSATAGHTVTIKNGAGATITTVPVATALQTSCAVVYWDGAAWQVGDFRTAE